MTAFALLALVLCLAGAAQAGGAGRVEVLAAHKGWIEDSRPRGPAEFGVNGTRLMWHDLTRFTSGSLRTLRLAGSTTSVTGRWPAGLAFAGDRTARRTVEGGLSLTNSVGASDRRGRHGGVVFDMPHEGSGGYLTDPYAVGSTIAYGWYETAVRKGSCDADGFDCDYMIRRGGLRLFDGVKPGRIVTNAPVAVLSLSSAGTAAYVRATSRWHQRDPSVIAGPSVIELVSLHSPRVLLRIRAPGRVSALALSDRVLVAGTQLTRQRRVLLFYDLGGRRLRVLPYGGYGPDFSEIAVRGSRVVLNGNGLIQVEAYTGAKRVLARSRGRIGGVAFAGDQLVWHETLGHDDATRYRILSMPLDR